MVHARARLIRSPLTLFCLISCLRNMETGLTPHENSLRQAIRPMVNQIWEEARSVPLQSLPFKPTAEGEAFYQRVQDLQPTNDTERGLKDRITQLATDLAQARLVLFSNLGQFNTLSFSGSVAPLDDNLIDWFFPYGSCQRDNFCGVTRLRTVGLCGHFSYSGTRSTVLGNNVDQQRTAEKRFVASERPCSCGWLPIIARRRPRSVYRVAYKRGPPELDDPAVADIRNRVEWRSNSLQLPNHRLMIGLVRGCLQTVAIGMTICSAPFESISAPDFASRP